ncbi:carboxylesterase [Diplocarpon rosae]|nr:carboxylesterase [Diplocarpon rosae]
MARNSFLVWIQLFLLLGSTAQGQHLVASLDYGTFQGAYSSTYNISYWRKIPYAAPPTGENRFRAPQAPIPVTNGTYDSDQPYGFCPQSTVHGTEDCLYLGLYSRPWTPSQSLRPVVVYFHGGGFIYGGGSFSIPPSGYPVLNVSSDTDLLFIYPNYRLNAFGFLPGSEISSSETSDLNPGLLDQKAVLHWTKRYISKFGGDPNNVTIWGQSAGAGSVVAQVLANNGGEAPLFRRALASSPFWPKTYRYNSPEAQNIYDTFAALSGCANNGSKTDSLACLKKADVQVLLNASFAVSDSHKWNTSSFTWAPVIDGVFLKRPLSEVDEVDIESGWGMYNTYEGISSVSFSGSLTIKEKIFTLQKLGEDFIPLSLAFAQNSGDPPFNSSASSFNAWLRGFLPGLSAQDIERVKALYPAIGSADNAPTYNTSYTRSGLIYRDVVFACPSYWIAGAARNKSYLGEYAVLPAKHSSDANLWDSVNPIQKSEPLIYNGFTGAIASFLQTGDPNKLKLTNATQSGVPELETELEFLIRKSGLESAGITQLKRRCEFWKEVGRDVPV